LKYDAQNHEPKMNWTVMTYGFTDFGVGLSFVACFKEFCTELELWKSEPQEEMKRAVLLYYTMAIEMLKYFNDSNSVCVFVVCDSVFGRNTRYGLDDLGIKSLVGMIFSVAV
jgi:hypothetical protein